MGHMTPELFDPTKYYHSKVGGIFCPYVRQKKDSVHNTDSAINSPKRSSMAGKRPSVQPSGCGAKHCRLEKELDPNNANDNAFSQVRFRL